jgi:protein phosphatase
VILAGLLGGGVWAFWRYTQSHYYVGVTDDGRVAVFQGIPGDIAGFELSTVDFISTTTIDELTPVAQQKVKEGISAASESEAKEQMDKLLDPDGKNMKPICPTPTPAMTTPPPVSPPASPTPGVLGSPTQSPTVQPTTPGPAATPDCRPAN